MIAIETQGTVDVATIELSLDTQIAEEVKEKVQQRWSSGQPAVVIDLHKVPLIDSAGLEMLVDLQRAAVERSGIVKLAAPNSLCKDILHASGLTQRFEVFPDTKSGVGSFSR